MKPFSRRSFLQNTGKLAAAATIGSIPLAETLASPASPASVRVGAADKIRVALIGCNSMGWANLREHIALPEVECIGLCDVDENVLNKRGAELEKQTGKKAILYRDFRKLLENKEVDAVIIGTPDHWHCLMAVYAMQAGKDVYVEKPLANSIDECNTMVAAAKQYGRVVQVGQWQRSGPHWQSAMEYVRSGKLGKISHVKNWLYYSGFKEMKPEPDTVAPPGVDYEMWLGPARKQAFNINRFHGKWRYFWDYGGGIMTDWGVHLLDMAFHGMQSTFPKSVMSTGGKYSFPQSAMQTPDNQFTTYDYGDYVVTWEHVTGSTPGLYGNNYCGVAFVGKNGTLVVDREKWRLFPEAENGQYLLPALPEQKGSGRDLALHVKNFIDCIKSRGKTACDIETARNVAVNGQLGNIAMKTGRKLYWDDASNLFINDREATQLVKPVYRAPWLLPKV
jgi:predicted dehydrogenase